MAAAREVLAGMRILVVEDEMLIALLIQQMLQELCCEVIGPVSSVEEAVGAVRAQPIDGALLDMSLNGKSSSPAAHDLIDHAVPFLLITGYDASDRDSPVFQTASRIGKPFEIEELADAMLEAFVGRLKARRRGSRNPGK
jgi:DNA-binding response OmpR family regulator